MKLLRNPFVSGALALVAVLIVAYQIAGPMLKRRAARRAAGPMTAMVSKAIQAAVQQATGVPASPGAPTAPSGGLNSPQARMDTAAILAKASLWVEAPARDPFRLFVPQPKESDGTNTPPSPVKTWKLNGIWRQTGGRVAAINNAVYREGDFVEGYKLVRIEGDLVWLQGTNRLEHLSFPAWPTSGTNAPAQRR